MAFQNDSIFWVEVEKIVPNPFQPRREFDEAKLKELAESVRMYGILQPLTVTRKEVQGEDGSFRSEYELIAGERRLRASKLAGLAQVPVIIRDGEQTEQEKLELAIIENLQREDLNAVDRALAFRQLADVFGLSFTQVAKKVGRSREYVSNTVRLLGLPDYMLDSLRVGDISEGHARTLLMLNDRPEEQDTVFREILLKKLSVREVERIARNIATEKVRKKETIDSDLIEFEKQFTETLGTRVSIVKTDYGGRLTIDYFSIEDLETMLEKMKDEKARFTGMTLPPQGSLRSEMELLEDRETRDALEVLSEKTGLEAVSVIPDGVVTEPEVVEVVRPVIPMVNFAPQFAVGENIPETSVVNEEVTVSQFEAKPDIQSVPPATEVAVPVAVETKVATPAQSPAVDLRAKLASLLNNHFASAKAPVETKEPTVENKVVEQKSMESEVKEIPKKEVVEEEADLYSINKFTI